MNTKRVVFASAAALAFAGAAVADEIVFTPGEGGYTWDSYTAFAEKYDLSGEKLTATGPWTGNEKVKVDKVFQLFAEATGADVEYTGSDSFEQDIVIATEADSAPNLAVFPQPGLARDLAAKGKLTPLPDGTAEWIAENFAAGNSWVDLATYPGPEGADHLYGMFYRVDVKSLVWYSPEAFDEFGYDVPETMEDLKALTDQIAEDGGTAWCVGLGSGAATGWPATDWVEDLMLRTQSPETYDKWVNHEISFDDPAVVSAIEDYGWFIEDGRVAGGKQAVANTDFRDSPSGLFTFPPECLMHRQASFIPAFFPEGTEVGEDVDFFYFPAYAEKDFGQPVLGAGTLFSITNDSPAAQAFIEFLELPVAHEAWMAQGGFVTAHNGVNLDLYSDDSLRAQGEILQNATTFRFDASDLMPAEIGADAFWKAMVSYSAGNASAAEAAAEVEGRWQSMGK